MLPDEAIHANMCGKSLLSRAMTGLREFALAAGIGLVAAGMVLAEQDGAAVQASEGDGARATDGVYQDYSEPEQTALLRKDLELKRLELQVARERAAKARQAALNVALLSLLLLGFVLWLAYSLVQQRRRAHTDYLTGIANRGRAFDQGFQLCDRAHRNNKPLSVVLFDLDRFKKVNDSLGHAAGDRALQEVVAVVSGILPRGALLARLGGEEFIAILPDLGLEQAQDVAEDIRTAVAASGFMHAGSHPVNVTVSLGVAALDESSNFQTLVNRADEALYVAKNSGRNRVVLASSTAERLSEGKVAVGSRHAHRNNPGA